VGASQKADYRGVGLLVVNTLCPHPTPPPPSPLEKDICMLHTVLTKGQYSNLLKKVENNRFTYKIEIMLGVKVPRVLLHERLQILFQKLKKLKSRKRK
jgi:hypothetical protein